MAPAAVTPEDADELNDIFVGWCNEIIKIQEGVLGRRIPTT